MATAMASRSVYSHAPSPAPRRSHGGRHLQVVRFGQPEPLDVDASALITFPAGLVGMDALRQFLVVEDSRTAPFRWLQSVEDASLAFVIVDPTIVAGEYGLELSGDDATQLGLNDPRDADIWAIVTVQPDPSRSTANLLAPVVINRQTGLGKQIILNESGYSLRYPLLPAAPGGTAGLASA